MFRRFFREALPPEEAERVAFLTVLAWIVHPVHPQTVTYIVQRMTVMAGSFLFLSFLAFLRAEDRPAGGRGRAAWLTILAFCMAAGAATPHFPPQHPYLTLTPTDIGIVLNSTTGTFTVTGSGGTCTEANTGGCSAAPPTPPGRFGRVNRSRRQASPTRTESEGGAREVPAVGHRITQFP